MTSENLHDVSHLASLVASDPHSQNLVGFDHEKLDVYLAALDFITLAHEAIAELPRGRSSVADQLERASISIALNVAEGGGEFSRKEKARFYRMALRSAAECAAILDVAVRLSAISQERAERGKVLLNRIAAMLTVLARLHETS